MVPGLHPNCAAAFSVDDGERENLVVVLETDGRVLRTSRPGELCERVAEKIWDDQRLKVDDIVIVRRGALSRTSSGKVARHACRRRYEDGELAPLIVSDREA